MKPAPCSRRSRVFVSLPRVLLRALVLLVVTAVACWPTWSLPDLDGTEGRRVQIALEMLRSGDWLVPSLGGQPTWAKPPLHYWIVATCQQWFGDLAVWARLPSVLGAFAMAWLAGEVLRRHFGAVAGWVGALGIACCPLVVGTWATVEIDPLFASFTAMSLLCLASGIADRRRGLVVASGLCGGLAMLQKGPPYFLFAAGAYIVWWRHLRLRAFFWHLLPLLGVTLCYYAPLWLWRVKPGEMLAVANEESVGRLLFLDWDHIKPIPEYWLRAVAVMLPFGFWARSEWRETAAGVPLTGAAGGVEVDGREVLLRMCRWAALLAFAALTVFPGRPTRYLLPGVPLLVVAFAPAVARFAARVGTLPAFARHAMSVVGAAASVALVVLPFVPGAGIAAIGCAAVAAVGAGLVRSGRDVVVYCLLLPVVGAWTVGLDRSQNWRNSPRARTPAGALLRRELSTLGVDGAELRTMGHFDSPLLLAAGLLPPGDEFARGAWQGRWILHETADRTLRVPDHYRARLRLDLPFKSFELRERVGDGR